VESVTRILETIDRADPDLVAVGRPWYVTAAKWTQTAADTFGTDRATVAGIVAALSPRLKWAQNRAAAVALLDTGRAPALAHNARRALAIMHGADPAEVLEPLEGGGDKLYGQKVAAFYRCLMDPWADAVAVDIWAARVAIPHAPKWHLDRHSRYTAAADAYRTAAGVLEWSPAETQAAAWVAVRGYAG